MAFTLPKGDSPNARRNRGGTDALRGAAGPAGGSGGSGGSGGPPPTRSGYGAGRDPSQALRGASDAPAPDVSAHLPQRQSPQLPDVDYPDTPAPLGPDDIARFGQRRRQATRRLAEGQAAAQRATAMAEADFERQRRQLSREAVEARLAARAGNANAGLGDSPIGQDRDEVAIRDERANEQARLARQRGRTISEAEERVNRLRRQREDALAAIDADRGRARADLRQLLPGVRY